MKFAKFAALMATCAPVMTLAQSAPTDPYLWLEDVSSPRAMAWVTARNAYAESVLTTDPHYAEIYAEALALAGAKDRIPAPQQLHGQIVNFWTDEQHLRGLVRTTTLADYRNPDPHWKTLVAKTSHSRSQGGTIIASSLEWRVF